MNYLKLNEKTLTNLQMFESIEGMNESIKAHKKAHELTEAQRAILDVISRYGCKYKGVCYLSKQKLAEAAGFKSRRTAIRACNRLEELGIIRQHKAKRTTGDRRQSSNIIVIVPVEVDSEVTADSHTEEAPAKAIKDITKSNTYSSEPFQSHYSRFKSVVGLLNIDNIQALVSRLYGVYKAHSTPLLRGQAFDKQSVEQVGIRALKTAIQATKTKPIRNLAGYYNGVLDRMLDRLFYAEMAEAMNV